MAEHVQTDPVVSLEVGEDPPADPAPETPEDGEVVVTIGEQAPEEAQDDEKAPAWVKELRRSVKEKDRLLREQSKRIAEFEAKQAPAAIVVGPEPTIEEYQWDQVKFKAAYKDWMTRSQQAEAQVREQQEKAQKTVEEWQGRYQGYVQAKQKLKVADFQTAEEAVTATFDQSQQSILIDAADRPELLVYALGKNPAKLKELAAITNPVRFTAALAKLETQLKVTPRKPGVAPERIPQGGSSAAGAAAVDNQLEKLREEANKTGDLTKLMAYKKQLRQKTA